MFTVIKALGFANDADCPIVNQYVEQFDHEADGGNGFGMFTRDIRKAKRFATRDEALKFYYAVPTCKPVREDGNPNRPLTATTVMFETYEENDARVQSETQH